MTALLIVVLKRIQASITAQQSLFQCQKVFSLMLKLLQQAMALPMERPSPKRAEQEVLF